MDIDLLSKMVKELILDQDRVVLPGLGSFVAEIVPATFSDKGYTINPPYRRLFFRAKPDDGDDLTSFYASYNKVAPELAERIIRDFLAELKAILYEKKTVVFPGLGRLRATKENHLFFVADENLDIYPEGFGLAPVSLKTHQETPEQVAAAVEGLKSMLVAESEPELQPEPAPVPETVPVPEPEIESEPETMPVEEPEQSVEPVIEIISEPDIEPEPAVEPEPEPVPEPTSVSEPISEPEQMQEHLPVSKTERKAWRTILKVVLWLVVAAVVLLAALVILGQMCPEIIDRVLYTPEELEIVKQL